MKNKSIKWEIVIVVVIGLILVGVLYYKFLLSAQLEEMKKIDADITSVESEIQKKEEELKKVGLIREEIAKIDTDIDFANMKIIPYMETPKKLILIEDSIKLNNLQQVSIKLEGGNEQKVHSNLDPESKEESESGLSYKDVTINMEVVGEYESLKVFLEQIKTSIKPFIIRKLDMQLNTEKEENRFLDNFLYGKSSDEEKKYVSAIIELSTYALNDNQLNDDEITNYNFMEYNYEYDNPFEQLKTIEEKISDVMNQGGEDEDENRGHANRPPANSNVKNFSIAIRDAYASGDNFYIVGPGDTGDYTIVQATTIRPTTFDIKLNPDGYEYSIKPEDQERKSYKKEMPLEQCSLDIVSTVDAIRNLQELNTSIYITNNTGKHLNVNVRGNFTDKIFIYSSSGTLIKPGDTVDNISVNIS